MTEAAVLAHRLARLRSERDPGASEIRDAIAALRLAMSGGVSLANGATEEIADGAAARRKAMRQPARLEELAQRLAGALDGEVVRDASGCHVRCERASASMPLDRERLARLPASVPVGAPLVCLDVETTGLATATGTVAFLIGLGWWEGELFRQVGLLLPDQSEERALLRALDSLIPPNAWLVTYNGRSFDWPLLVARYRMAGAPAPGHAGHLDLLPFVRRVIRHRLMDARLATVEAEVLAVRRERDVAGWEIPGMYLAFLRGGPAAPLADVVRHNHEDVRSLARLLGHLERAYGDADARATAPRGDLAGLARAYRSEGRYDEALSCFDAALAAGDPRVAIPKTARWGTEHLPFGARPWEAASNQPSIGEDAVRAERARLLRRLGRQADVLAAWQELALGGGPLAALAWIEVAKLLEHRQRDLLGALAAADRAAHALDRERLLRRPRPRLEADLNLRMARLRRRIAGRRRAA